jgi:pyruvate/2-oxoglutarate dehydrogenase complex dihydrolipoamide acyltransferase (E2) component
MIGIPSEYRTLYRYIGAFSPRESAPQSPSMRTTRWRSVRYSLRAPAAMLNSRRPCHTDGRRRCASLRRHQCHRCRSHLGSRGCHLPAVTTLPLLLACQCKPARTKTPHNTKCHSVKALHLNPESKRFWIGAAAPAAAPAAAAAAAAPAAAAAAPAPAAAAAAAAIAAAAAAATTLISSRPSSLTCSRTCWL